MIRIDNENQKEDQIRRIAGLHYNMLLYPVGIFERDTIGYETTGQLLVDIAPTYFVSIPALVASFLTHKHTQKQER